MKAGVYLRISKDDGRGLGVERQREDCLRYVEAKGWELARCYTDNDVSATKSAARPEFEAMLKAVQAGELDVIISYHLDRLLRRLAELERVFTICQAAGAHIITVADGVDTSSDGGRLVARILASVAQGEVERKSARQKRAMIQRAERGLAWGGRAFGYNEQNAPNKSEAAAIKRGYNAILKGETLHAVARDWNSKGHKTTRGNTWRGTTVKIVLCNPRYAGLRSHLGEIVGPGQWEAIIDTDTWHAVTAILTDPQRRAKHTADRSHKFLLTGILTCGKCGHKLSVGGKSDAKNYQCKQMGCYAVTRRVEQLDAIITDVIKARLRRPDAAHLFIPPESDVRDLYEQLRARRAKLDQIAIDYADDVLDSRQAKTAGKRVEAAIQEIEAQIAERSRSDSFGDFPPSDPAAWFDSMPISRRRALIPTLCRVKIHPVGRGWRGGAGHRGVEIQWAM